MTSTSTSPTPTVVLVHGAWADGSSWRDVILALQGAGIEARAVQLPLSSLADDVAATRRVLDRINGPVVLVGHSYGGAVVTNAGTPDVAALVYIAAFVPGEGETIADLNAKFPQPAGSSAILPGVDGYLWIDPAAFPAAFAGDVEAPLAAMLGAAQKPIAASCFGDVTSVAGWRNVPSFALVTAADQMIPPQQLRWMADRAGATVTEVDGGSHAIMVSHPFAVVEVIGAAIKAALSPAVSP